MKVLKKILFIVLCGIIILNMTGCREQSRKYVTVTELKKLQEQITDSISSYHNFASCFLDEEKKIVVVELIDNSEEEQEWFRKHIIHSSYVQFRQGGPYTTSGFNFYIEKKGVHHNLHFTPYYSTSDRTVYLSSNIDDFYIVDEKKISLKSYFSNVSQDFDKSIQSLTANMKIENILKDGGTTIYKAREKDITMIVCNTLDGNKDIYIGDDSLEYEQTMCQSKTNQK